MISINNKSAVQRHFGAKKVPRPNLVLDIELTVWPYKNPKICPKSVLNARRSQVCVEHTVDPVSNLPAVARFQPTSASTFPRSSNKGGRKGKGTYGLWYQTAR